MSVWRRVAPSEFGSTVHMEDQLHISSSTIVADDTKFQFGDDVDAYIMYREGTDNLLEISGGVAGMVLSGSNINLVAYAAGGMGGTYGNVMITGSTLIADSSPISSSSGATFGGASVISNALNVSGAFTCAGNVVISDATDGILHTGTGTVTQGTSITTGVTVNASSGIITMHATAIAAAQNIEFTVTNSVMKTTSVLLVSMQDENTVDNAQLVVASHTHGNGSFKLTVANTDGENASSATAVKIHFLIVNPS